MAHFRDMKIYYKAMHTKYGVTHIYCFIYLLFDMFTTQIRTITKSNKRALC